ncbi:organomercurial lyase MerB [Variovorax soli]|uniref:organomercurial lyase MerB n=1 Tax=Variovorax soli TaxID=376815 RepID=UPI000A8D970C|nr:organomercurial lyase MerB [Variovorax soli]
MPSVAAAMIDKSDFATLIIDGLSGGSRLEGFASVFVALLRELVKGSPVSVRVLAEASGQSLDQVDAVLRQAPDIEYDPAGNIVGYGITQRQTPHVFEVEGRRLYTWCALDTLMFPALIGKSARVRSLCPETGMPVSLTAAPHELCAVEPLDAAVSLAVPQTGIRQSFCCQVHFFASRADGDRWALRHPEVEVVSVEAAFLLGQEIARRLAQSAKVLLPTLDENHP